MSGLTELKNEMLVSGHPVLVLVVGFHGAGKSSLISRLKEEFPDSYCGSASSLLSWKSEDKKVGDVAANQIKLIAAIKELEKVHSFIILDGHLCILNQNHEYEFIGMDVIHAVDPSMIILVSAQPDTIEKRLLARTGSDSLSIDHIKEGIILELVWARSISELLRIPLYNIQN